MRTLVRILLIALSSIVCLAQQQTVFADYALYNTVLDELFRTDSGNFTDQTKVDEIVLRFSSSTLMRELQITVTERRSQTPVYKLWRVPKGQPSVWDQVAEISSRSSSQDPKKIAALIQIEQKVIKRPSERLKQLTKEFSQLRFSPSLNRGLIVDAAQYDLWFASLSNHTHFCLGGSPRGQPSDHPLILWMIEVRSEIDR